MFLLQVWTINGQMVFEKPLHKPPANWNICGNKLLYLEDTNSEVVHLVYLYIDTAPRLFKFILPIDLIQGRVNSVYSAGDNNFMVPQDRKIPPPTNIQSQEFTEEQDRVNQSSTDRNDVDDSLLQQKSLRSMMKTTK